MIRRQRRRPPNYLVVEEWDDDQIVKQFLHTRSIALESQHFAAAKEHIKAQLSKKLKVSHYEILRREILSTKSKLNTKTTIATWRKSVADLLGETICASKKVGLPKPTLQDRLGPKQGSVKETEKKPVKDRLGEKKPKKSDTETIKCFNCNEEGHYKKDCKKEQTCYKCQMTGHLSADCPEGKTGTGNTKEQRALAWKDRKDKE